MTLWDRIARWRATAEHREGNFRRAMESCAAELESDLRELRELAAKWRKREAVDFEASLVEAAKTQCADELEKAIGRCP